LRSRSTGREMEETMIAETMIAAIYARRQLEGLEERR
jgi:hypothetical protein